MKTQASTVTAVLFELLRGHMESSGDNAHFFGGAGGSHASIQSVNNIPHPQNPDNHGKIILGLDDGSFFTISIEPGLK